VARALNGLALDLDRVGAAQEAARMFRRAAEAAEAASRPADALQALTNLCSLLVGRDLRATLVAGEQAVDLGKRMPVQPQFEYAQAHLALCRWLSGDWGRTRELLDRIDGISVLGDAGARCVAAALSANTGVPSREHSTPASQAEDPHLRAFQTAAEELERAHPQPGPLARAVRDLALFFGQYDEFLWTLAVDIALDAGEPETAAELCNLVGAEPRPTPLLIAQLHRLRGRLVRAEGRPADAVRELEAAVQALDTFGAPFYAARARLSLAEALTDLDRSAEAEALVAEAADTFERLGALPWLDRARRAAPRRRQSPGDDLAREGRAVVESGHD
jgi:tetratricopeptide (TPR) repeat protein